MRRYGIVRGASIHCDIHEQARALRREMTPAGTILWAALRKNRLAGYHFRRQQVLESFIVDFTAIVPASSWKSMAAFISRRLPPMPNAMLS